MSFNLIPLDHEDAIKGLPSLNMINNTLLLIQTIKNMPTYSLTCLDKKQHEQKQQQIPQEEHSIELEINNTEKTAIQTPDVKKKKSTGCTCRKTNCLKRYCECFSSGKTCTSQCACCGCFNTQQYDELVKQAKEEIKCKSAKKATQGCICKKSQCQKKYCQCFNAGISCTDACKCIDCQNNSPHSHSHQQLGSEKQLANQKHANKQPTNQNSKLKSELSFSLLEGISGLDA